MKIYIAVMYDRHIDDAYSVHTSLEGANAVVDNFMAQYPQYGTPKEHNPRRSRWARFVGYGDNLPHALIEVSELKE